MKLEEIFKEIAIDLEELKIQEDKKASIISNESLKRKQFLTEINNSNNTSCC